MTRIQERKIAIIVFLAVMILSIALSFGMPSMVAYASDSNVNFDDTNVLDDLQSSTVNGKPFDLLDFAFDESKSIRIINFVEYCYSYRKSQQNNYGIYVYIYNPKGLDISENSGQNKIQMAVSWTKDANGKLVADRYEKFRLRFCNKSEKTNYKGLFYKFKVVDREIDGKTMAERINSNERRYDVSGVELLTNGNQNATEYGVGGVYKFTGYAKGYGDSDEDTLSCIVEDLETLTLEIHHTNFRTNVSNRGRGHYNEINTVYFSVPDRIFKEYGNLQKIRAEWWEYKTQMALILSNKEFVDYALPYAGVSVEEYKPIGNEVYRPHNSTVPFTVYSYNNLKSSSGHSSFFWEYNLDMSPIKAGGVGIAHTKSADYISTILPYIFYSPASNESSVFDFLTAKSNTGNVNDTVVSDRIYSYKNDLGNGYIDCNGRMISNDLFVDYVDEGRERGHNDKTIDLRDTFDLNSYDSNHTWWDKLWTYGFSWPSTNGDYKNIAPIYEVSASDLLGTDEQLSEKLLINRDDISDFRKYYSVENLKGNHIILFRFANTDYYCESTFAYSNERQNFTSDGYIAQQTVFLNFDIIELTFNKDGVYRVIPVVSSPTDIINGFTAPPRLKNILAIIISVILAILLLVVLGATGILPMIIKGMVWLIFLPFRIIFKVIKSINQKQKNGRGGSK